MVALVGTLIALSALQGINAAHRTLVQLRARFFAAQLDFVRPFGGDAAGTHFQSNTICWAVVIISVFVFALRFNAAFWAFASAWKRP